MVYNDKNRPMLQIKSDCIFCSIASGKTDQPIRSETDNVAIFDDRSPKARYHFQCVPKTHIRDPKKLTHKDIPLAGTMVDCAGEDGSMTYFVRFSSSLYSLKKLLSLRTEQF
uniref:Uncharacterized protein n=1 Tax=Trichobilharzia regenti TaxID=157069 RepID=A0AA85K4W2_TRIRE|nr:unnamed protein product [Trichobilharzia regenti]